MCPDPLAGTGRVFSRFWVTKMHRSAHSRPVFFLLPILAEVVVGKPSSRSKPHNTWRGKLVSCLPSQQETWNNFFRIFTITWCVRLLKVIFFQRCLSLLSENLALRDKKKKRRGHPKSSISMTVLLVIQRNMYPFTQRCLQNQDPGEQCCFYKQLFKTATSCFCAELHGNSSVPVVFHSGQL